MGIFVLGPCLRSQLTDPTRYLSEESQKRANWLGTELQPGASAAPDSCVGRRARQQRLPAPALELSDMDLLVGYHEQKGADLQK